MIRQVSGDKGFTLVETLVGAALSVVVVTAVMSALYVAMGGARTKFVTQPGEQAEQLRAALRQLTDDLSNVDYFGPDADYDLTVLALHPIVTPMDAYPNWPGDLTDYPLIEVSYKIENGNLYRDVWDEVGRMSNRQLVSDLDPSSYIRYDVTNDKVVHVALRKAVPGGDHFVEVRSDYFLH